MPLDLGGDLRERLRRAVVVRIGRDDFVLFASDHLGVTDFRSEVGQTGFELQLHEFLINFDVEDFIRLANGLKRARPNAPDIQGIADELLAFSSAFAATPPQSNGYFLRGDRLFLNRDNLRNRLAHFPNCSGIQRLLVVNGEHSSGKTYSKLLISQAIGNIALVQANLPATASGELEAHDIAFAIADRLWKDTRFIRFDDFGQLARDAKWLGDRLIQGLCELETPTLLIVDQFESAPLSKGASDLIQRLLSSIEFGECNRLWLVLIGLDISQIAQYRTLINPDVACPPEAGDIAKFLIAAAAQAGHELQEADVADDAKELASVLKPTRTLEVWQDFELKLRAASARHARGQPNG